MKPPILIIGLLLMITLATATTQEISIENIKPTKQKPIIEETNIEEPEPILKKEKTKKPKFEEFPTIRLSNENPRIILKLSDYLTDKDNNLNEIKIKVSSNKFIAFEKKSKITIRYTGQETNENEWIKIRAKDPEGNTAETQIRTTYINIEEEKPPTQSQTEPTFNQQKTTPTNFMAGPSTIQTINLEEGWNLISLAVVPQNFNIKTILEPIEPYYDAVYSIGYNRYENKWLAYIPGINNTLENLTTGSAFWIRTTEPTTLQITGYEIFQTETMLNEGWNHMSHPNGGISNTQTLFENILPYIEIIYAYDTTNQEWKKYKESLPPPLNTLSTIIPGQGLYVKANTPITIEYDGTTNKYYLQEIDNNNQYKEKHYVPIAGRIYAQTDGTNYNYYHSDILGSTRVMTDETGQKTWEQTYYPFGKQIQATGKGTSIKFTGKEYDYQTKLHNYGARSYNAETGRFIQADTFDGDITNTQALNKYAYVNNNPLKYTDPSGNKAQHKTKTVYEARKAKQNPTPPTPPPKLVNQPPPKLVETKISSTGKDKGTHNVRINPSRQKQLKAVGNGKSAVGLIQDVVDEVNFINNEPKRLGVIARTNHNNYFRQFASPLRKESQYDVGSIFNPGTIVDPGWIEPTQEEVMAAMTAVETEEDAEEFLRWGSRWFSRDEGGNLLMSGEKMSKEQFNALWRVEAIIFGGPLVPPNIGPPTEMQPIDAFPENNLVLPPLTFPIIW